MRESDYRSVPGKCPCTAFQGATIAASIQTYGILIPDKRPCRPKSRVMFKCLPRTLRYVQMDELKQCHSTCEELIDSQPLL